MVVSTPSLNEIISRLQNAVIANTGLRGNLTDSVYGGIIIACAREFHNIFQELSIAIENSDLSTATGASLDNIGLRIGLPRKVARQATTLGRTKAVRFTNNGGGLATIPSRTRVWNDNEPQLAFLTNEGLSLNPGEFGEVHVTAIDSGEVYNVPLNYLNTHNAGPSIGVRNILPIDNGSSLESDGQYRERLLQEFRRRRVLNKDNCNALIRSVPSVQDAFIIEQHRGPGTFDVIIVPWIESETSTAISEVTALLSENVNIATNFEVRGPRYIPLDISIQLNFSPRDPDRREAVRQSIEAQIRSRISNLPMEDGSGIGTIYYNQIRGIVENTSDLVLNSTVEIAVNGSYRSATGSERLSIGDRLIIRTLSIT